MPALPAGPEITCGLANAPNFTMAGNHEDCTRAKTTGGNPVFGRAVGDCNASFIGMRSTALRTGSEGVPFRKIRFRLFGEAGF